MRIGTDIDGVVAEFTEGYLKFYNALRGTHFGERDVARYDFWADWGISMREALESMSEFYASPEFDELGLVEGAGRGIRALPREGKLAVITCRPLWIEGKTQNFFRKHFPDVPIDLHFAEGVFSEWGKAKGELCKELKLDVFIDDSASVLRGCCANGTRLFLFDRRWNEKEEVPGAERAYGWGHVLEKLGVVV